MVFLPPEIWNRIFEFDRTYRDLFQKNVLPELHASHTEFIADIFVHHFFWDTDDAIVSRKHSKGSFELKTRSGAGFLIEFINDATIITYRVHNKRTGTWYDVFLE